jgi:hypothetical protein
MKARLAEEKRMQRSASMTATDQDDDDQDDDDVKILTVEEVEAIMVQVALLEETPGLVVQAAVKKEGGDGGDGAGYGGGDRDIKKERGVKAKEEKIDRGGGGYGGYGGIKKERGVKEQRASLAAYSGKEQQLVLLLAEAQRKLAATPNDANLQAEFDSYTRELAHLELGVGLGGAVKREGAPAGIGGAGGLGGGGFGGGSAKAHVKREGAPAGIGGGGGLGGGGFVGGSAKAHIKAERDIKVKEEKLDPGAGGYGGYGDIKAERELGVVPASMATYFDKHPIQQESYQEARTKGQLRVVAQYEANAASSLDDDGGDQAADQNRFLALPLPDRDTKVEREFGLQPGALAESRRAAGEQRAVANSLFALNGVADVADSGWTEDEKAEEPDLKAAEMETGGDLIATRFAAEVALFGPPLSVEEEDATHV